MTRSFLGATCLALPSLLVAQTNVERELIARSNELMSAVERQDRAALELLVADEFMLEVPGDTAWVPRAEWIDNAVNLKWEGFKFHNVKVRSFGEVAVVSSLLDYTVAFGIGIPISSATPATDVWVRREGRWQIAVRQLGDDRLFGIGHMIIGFLAGILLWFLVVMVRRFRRRDTARKAVVLAS